MDFKTVIGIIVEEFGKYHIQYGLIGGFAMGALGIMRNTVDLDLLVKKSDLAQIDSIFTAHLYQLVYRSENVSQYEAAVKPLGSIDLLHAFRSPSLSMLQRARKIPVFNGLYEISVLIPEDIIGLKVQAMINDPKRRTLELADIELLMEHFSDTMDWQFIEEYFTLFDIKHEFDALRTQYGNIE